MNYLLIHACRLFGVNLWCCMDIFNDFHCHHVSQNTMHYVLMLRKPNDIFQTNTLRLISKISYYGLVTLVVIVITLRQILGTFSFTIGSTVPLQTLLMLTRLYNSLLEYLPFP